MRQIVLDTETTGLEPEQGHRVIEIGGVEIISRKLTGRRFHRYVNPNREVDDAAFEVHGLSAEFLSDKPDFQDLAEELIEFVAGAELVIHNAPFDVSFLDYELSRLRPKRRVTDFCTVTDSLALARHKHPGQKNNLDALCRRYEVDNSARDLHGALLDAEILADVYLLMTGGQTMLFGGDQDNQNEAATFQVTRLPENRSKLLVINASDEELAEHEKRLDALDQRASEGAVWRRSGGAG